MAVHEACLLLLPACHPQPLLLETSLRQGFERLFGLTLLNDHAACSWGRRGYYPSAWQEESPTCCSAETMSAPYSWRLFLEKRGTLDRLLSACMVQGRARARASIVGPSRILCCRPAYIPKPR